MTEIISNNEDKEQRARQFFVPGAAEIVLYFLISIIALVVLNYGKVIVKLSNNYIDLPEKLPANFSTLSDNFSHTFASALGGRLGQIILWSFIGALCYIGLWLAKNVLNSFENDIIAEHYTHPSSYSRTGYWGSSLAVKVFLFASIVITASYVFVAAEAVLPAVAALAGSAAYNFHLSASLLYIILAIIGTALVIYIGVVFFRLISHLWKLL